MGFFDGGDTSSKTEQLSAQQTITPQLTGGGSGSGSIINISPFSGLVFNDKISSKAATGGVKAIASKGGKGGGTSPLGQQSASTGGAGGASSGTVSGLDGVTGDSASSAFDAGFSLDLSVESLTPEAAQLFGTAQELTSDVVGQFSSLVDYSRDVLESALASSDRNVSRALDFVTGLSTQAADSVTRGASLGAAAAQGSPVIVGSGNLDPKLAFLAVAALGLVLYLKK